MSISDHPALIDLEEGLRLWRYWSYRALLNHRLKFSDTRLGFLWPGVSLVFVVAVLGSIWGLVLNKENITDYIVYLFAGFAVWQFLSGAINQGNMRVGSLGAGASISAVVMERWTVILLSFGTVLPVAIVARLAGSGGYSHLAYLPAGIVSLVFWSFGVLLLVLVLSTLVPDARQLVQSIMRLAFLATPIIWEASRLGEYKNYLWLNPFFPPLEIARFAITGQTYVESGFLFAVLYCFGIFAVGMMLFFTQYSRMRIRIV